MIGRSRIRRSTTLIEVVTAIVILSVSMPPLLRAFADSAMHCAQPANEAIAALLATERMEQIVARRYRDDTGYAALTTVNFPNESPITGFPRYSRTVTITEVTSSLAASGSAVGYRKVRVAVTWSSGAYQVYAERLFADF